MLPPELPWISRSTAERRFPALHTWIEPEYGGHFGALEVPDAMTEGLFEILRRGAEPSA